MVDPNQYNNTNILQKCKIQFVIEEFKDYLADVCGKCMDIGCGSGNVTKEILLPALGSAAQIIGTDISKNMIEYAKKTFNDEKRLQFEVLDIQTKSLPEKYICEFDHVFSSHTLQWCNNIRQALTNIYEMLRYNGTTLLYIIASHNVYDVLNTLIHDIRFAQYAPDNMKTIAPFQNRSNARNELTELLQSIGFKVHHCSLREATSSGKPEIFLKSITSILTIFDNMPESVIKEFKNSLASEYFKRITYKLTCENQEFTLDTYTFLVAYAQKM
ncbi:hypothetical protein PUN28_001179 [Cardiocondyla obscurior]|uniref:Methyltransferase type 12 domain-containing protein n=3 Tax=Cardiocondyla obscurior TaxID=286306 RepID=A0AAW2H3M9_9HYME